MPAPQGRRRRAMLGWDETHSGSHVKTSNLAVRRRTMSISLGFIFAFLQEINGQVAHWNIT